MKTFGGGSLIPAERYPVAFGHLARLEKADALRLRCLRDSFCRRVFCPDTKHRMTASSPIFPISAGWRKSAYVVILWKNNAV